MGEARERAVREIRALEQADRARYEAEQREGAGIWRLVDLYDQGHRDGEEATLDTLSQRLASMAKGAEEAGIAQSMTYASGIRDAATLVRRTLEQRRREWGDADPQ